MPAPASYISGSSKICSGHNTTLYASGGTSYLWNTGSTNDSISVMPLKDSVFSVIAFLGNCSDTASQKIVVNLTPNAVACCDSSILYGQQVQLISNGGVSYSWAPSMGLNCDTCPNTIASPDKTTTYTLTVTSDSGCITTQYVTIEVHCGDVFVPDAFSPGGEYNNILYVRGACIQNLDFMVFDRWGNKLFESQNPDFGWDGNYKGTAMNMGTYMYYAKATMNDGSVVEKHGNVTLVR